MAFTLEAVWLVAFGPEGRTVRALGSFNDPAISGSGLTVRWITLVDLVVGGALLAGLLALLNRTSIGLQMRAAAFDARAARLLGGVRADRVIAVAFVLAGCWRAWWRCCSPCSSPSCTTFGLEVTILALVGVVVGGMERLDRATAGGFVIGFASSVVGDLLPSSGRVYLTSWVFILVIAVLLVRPAGLFAPLRSQPTERV